MSRLNLCPMQESKSTSTTVVLGTVPPPMGGAAKNNRIVFEALRRSSSNEVILIDTSIGDLAHCRSARYYLRKLTNFVSSLKRLMVCGTGQEKKLYIVPDGGWGLWISVCYVAVARLRGFEIYQHHRTFAYVDTWALSMRILTWVARATSCHVFLSDGMSRKFCQKYGEIQDKLICSNARFVEPQSPEFGNAKSSPIRLGYLSNLCREKGVYDVIEAFEAIAGNDESVSLVIAGKAVTQKVANDVADFKSRWKHRVKLLGHVEGQEKADFYANIDVFLFPTRFRQEAQPNVIFEAMSYGACCISVRRACIPEMYDSDAGIIVDDIDSYVPAVCDFVSRVQHMPSTLAEFKQAAYRTVQAKRLLALGQFETMIRRLV